jgi:hypothetical protein
MRILVSSICGRLMNRVVQLILIHSGRLFSSRSALIGYRMISFARTAQLIEPILVFILFIAAATIDAFAQPPGGNIFGSDQQVGNAIREAIKWGRNLLFLMGIVFVGWGVVNFGTDKPSAKQFIAAIGCFAFGGIVALVYSISQGNAVNLDTGFGN